MKELPAAGRSRKEENGTLTSHICLEADASIGKLHFKISYIAGKEHKELVGTWNSKESGNCSLSLLSGELENTPLSFQVPELITGYGLAIKELRFGYIFEAGEFSFRLSTTEYGALSVSTRKDAKQREFTFKLELGMKLSLSAMPLIGECSGCDMAVELDWLSLKLRGSQKAALSACLAFLLGSTRIPLSLPENNYSQETSGSRELQNRGEKTEDGDVKWLDVKKSLGPVRLSRLGFLLGEGSITVYVDAGFTLSILMFEVLGLYVTVPMKKGISVAFGIQGMTVSIHKEPLSISGGLYITREKGVELYTGELSVQVKNFQLTAVGSYGKLPGSEASFFAYLMLRYPLGGPPAFYVTGIAGGFGYNRTILLPSKAEEVRSFPFVAAVMGGGTLTEKMTPAQVLKEMNASIVPCKGQFFAAAGIRFTSFGLLDSFLLLNVVWGNELKIALMGVSTLSLPPGESKPFVYAELSLLAVISPAVGEISISGALSSQSFLMDRNCRLQGGFAFVTWFGNNEHSGDFVLTLGGYKEGFYVAHYPKVDRIGIKWNIDKNLVLSASFYFALTPSCVMLGGNASITYEWGRLRAWFQARLEFYMKWKPFAYEFYVGISLGASFRWDFFPFYRTFTLELGASLNCYGPPFGGNVHISWFIISFTISFGAGKGGEKALNWEEFSEAFLKAESDNNGRKILSVQASGDSPVKGADGLSWYSTDRLVLEIKSLLPATAVSVSGKEKDLVPETGNTEPLGVVPMRIETFTSVMKAEVTDNAGRIQDVRAEWIYGNIPKALWDTKTPDPYGSEGLKKDQLLGIRLKAPEPKVLNRLPQKGYYSMAVLCENERLEPLYFTWPESKPVEPKVYPGDVLKQIERTIAVNEKRSGVLKQLSENYGTAEKADMENWGGDLEEILLGEPVLSAMGSER